MEEFIPIVLGAIIIGPADWAVRRRNAALGLGMDERAIKGVTRVIRVIGVVVLLMGLRIAAAAMQ